MTIYKRGSRGTAVVQIQKALNLVPDGVYGPLTEEAVRTYQLENGLKVDGIVGVATLSRLLKLIPVKSKRRIDEIIVHCTATREGQPKTVEQLRAEHKRRGWSDIGYHYVVTLDGGVHTGRNVNLVGAHVAGHNAHSIGVVYVGGIDKYGRAKDTRTDEQRAALLSLLLELRRLYPTARIRGHRDCSPDLDGDGQVEPSEWVKQCPCFDATKEYRKV